MSVRVVRIKVTVNLVLHMSTSDDVDFPKVRLLRGKRPVLRPSLRLYFGSCVYFTYTPKNAIIPDKKNFFKRKDKNSSGFHTFHSATDDSCLLIIAISSTLKLYRKITNLTHTLHNIIKSIVLSRENFKYVDVTFFEMIETVYI